MRTLTAGEFLQRPGLVRTLRRSQSVLPLVIMVAAASCGQVLGAASNGPKRCAFIAITNLSGFACATAGLTNETVFTSPELTAPIDWNEMIVSWNVIART